MDSVNNKPVYLDSERCNGCVSCMKRCPTEAIRVRDGKATILYERCVGCGECVKVCPTKAKKENFDKFGEIGSYCAERGIKYKVAVPSPSIYGQFNNLHDIDYVLSGILKLGFDDVFDAAISAETISAATRAYIAEGKAEKPLISSACPAITNLILMRYEHLISHLSPLLQPEILAAKQARQISAENTGLKPEEIGIFVITQCAANVMEFKKSENYGVVDKVLSFTEIYVPLLGEMNRLTSVKPHEHCGKLGVSWGCSTGEAVGIGTDNFIAADGIENVMTVLNDLEHEKLNNLDFLELYACTSGCVGGSMNIENPFLARTRLRLLRKQMPINDITVTDAAQYMRNSVYCPHNIFKLDDNRIEALKKMVAVKELYSTLPQLDCGACGAPNCMAFAEDVIKGLKVTCKYRKD